MRQGDMYNYEEPNSFSKRTPDNPVGYGGALSPTVISIIIFAISILLLATIIMVTISYYQKNEEQ